MATNQLATPHAPIFLPPSRRKDHIDEDGVEMLEDQVRGAAVTAAGEAIKELGVEFFKHEGWRFWVTDEAGKTVCSLRLTGG